jgi:16S rRNA C1402 N4-methylase RsmH
MLNDHKSHSTADASIAADARVMELAGKLQLLQSQIADIPPHIMSSTHAMVDSKISDLGADVTALKAQLKGFMYEQHPSFTMFL